jgi:photosystem II stability/assembly factor-like uncharacterized protein
MRVITFVFVLIICFASAQKVSIKNVLEKLPTSIRGLSVVDDRVVWFSGSKGYVGRSIDGGANWKVQQVKDFEKVDFRSLYAFDSLKAIIANAGSPASILKTADGGKTWKEVYRNEQPEIFLDGIDFWDDKRGILYGDPINGRMEILKTHNGGDTWVEVSKQHRPLLSDGEASFAASGTGIRCFDNTNVVIATGGTVSRLWLSHNDGESWFPFEVPIIQGKASTGIFSVGIGKKKIVVVGGDYEIDSLKQDHVFVSAKEDYVWQKPTIQTGGYRSGVEFISGKTWIAVGQGGADISSDDAKTWKPFEAGKGLHVVRRARNGKKVFMAGNGRVVEVMIGK